MEHSKEAIRRARRSFARICRHFELEPEVADLMLEWRLAGLSFELWRETCQTFIDAELKRREIAAV